jgi:hypothetical protein
MEQITMNKLPEYLERFITRDINYLIGGGCVVASFLYSFGRLNLGDWRPFLLAVGIAYVVGYAMQDLFGIFRVVSTMPNAKPWKSMKWVYRRFTYEDYKDWRPIGGADVETIEAKSLEHFETYPRAHFEYERIISLMQVGTTMGPCCIVSGAILLANFIVSTVDGAFSTFDVILTVATVALGFGFCILGWLKNMQWQQQLRRLDSVGAGSTEKKAPPKRTASRQPRKRGRRTA